jgi:dTDP-4-amino-4,6-dideoxygalactose transaminase
VKLRTLGARLASRRRLADLYREGLHEFPHIIAPVVRAGCAHGHHLYVVRVRQQQRDALMQHLLEAGVPVVRHFPAALHQQPAYAPARRGPLTQTEALIPEILSLPLHPYLDDEAVRFTLEAIRRFTVR